MPTVKEYTPSRPAYFWWFLANILALCFAVTSWVACMHVFGNPEIPRNYEWLKRLGRLPDIKRHTVLDVPDGGSLDPAGLYARYFPMEGKAREVFNSRLIRNYLTNFEQPRVLTYVEGEYQIVGVRPLHRDDFIPQGFVVRARAMVKHEGQTKRVPYPVLIDYLFPTAQVDAIAGFRQGDLLDVKKSPNCAAILHVDRITDQDDLLLCLSVVPIAYGPYQAGGGVGFEIAPPSQVSPGAEFPAFGR